ncbi:MAG: TM0996/MTH895 family glutaredoxin-like protein [Candidatus Fermentibacteraceae bacterium]|nr:TM0996/MTH895 family glutaredoxin-like protein [Candidatus Fermentibacteraceae bacterium]MBN2607847.1 TM0996/MTH895 family glutaredoxin-like protein [Candidatus Fermentibacteraceae bacterium]
MNRTVKVLGTGCLKCSTLFHNTQQAMDNLGIEAEIEMITNINDIISFGVAVTPALVIDDMVWTSGEVPSVEEIQVIFRKNGSMQVEGS